MMVILLVMNLNLILLGFAVLWRVTLQIKGSDGFLTKAGNCK